MADAGPVILVLDLGLTNCKSIVFSADGALIERASCPYSTYYPKPGYVEQDPDEWWSAVCRATNEIWQRRPTLARQIDCISVTAHMHALVGLGKDGRSFDPALILGDQRSLQAAEQITQKIGMERIYKITGARMDASMPAAKIRWLLNYSPYIGQMTRAFLGCKDYIRNRLTGDCLTDPIDACATSLYDLGKATWSNELVQAAGIDEGQLPAIADPTQIAGALLPQPAAELNLRSGIPVVVGSGDDIEVLGNGLMNPGRSLEHFGTTGSILTCSSAPVFDPQMGLELYPHAQPGLWVLGGSITAAGSALAWTSKLLGFENLDEALATLTQSTPPDASPLIFLPHLLGERSPSWQPHSRGAWIGLTTTHTSSELMRASLEGVAFALRHILDSIESLVGIQEIITVSERQDDSSEWLQLRSDIYGRPLGLIQTTDPTALGAMQLASVGIGLYQDLGQAVKLTTRLEGRIEPSASSAAAHEKGYRHYQKSRSAMAEYWEYVSSALG